MKVLNDKIVRYLIVFECTEYPLFSFEFEFKLSFWSPTAIGGLSLCFKLSSDLMVNVFDTSYLFLNL